MKRNWFDDWCAKCGHWSKCDCTMQPPDKGAAIAAAQQTQGGSSV